ncbi:alpha/beta hydrolase [Microbacterium panaciterrae]|uniref:Alpha/beta hydrolase n=1 Tax=Microbacterium panaciterrae TaxID=985759 RepID=A0ABP8PJZ9_9MICO
MNETERLLGLLNETFPDLAAMPPADARAAADSRVRPAPNLDDVARVDDVSIEAGAHVIPTRTYHPHTRVVGAPATVFAHGGGFLHGSIASHDGFCRRWARNTGAPVISVEYRVATEAPPPAARDDVLAAVCWAQDHGIADHGLVLAGDSSGATLAASAAVALRDRGDTTVTGQVLLYPFLDPSMSTESHCTRGVGFFVTDRLLAYYWRTYLAGRSANDPDVTPLAVDDLTGLPPAIIVTAGLDPLRDEGELYAQRLHDAGVPVVLRRHPDQFHGFLTILGYGPAASAAELLWSDIRTLSPA